MTPHKYSKNKKYNSVHKETHRNLIENLFSPDLTTQAGTCRQSLSFIDSSIFETSDAEKLVKYIRQKRGINYAKRIFDDSPANEVAERSFPIEIQPIQEKAKAVSPLKYSTKEGTTSSNPRIPRVHLKRISLQRESIGKRIFLKNFEKASGSGENFQPAAFSTPNSVVINEDPNISGISKITRDEEIPETQEPNELPKTAENNHKAIFDAGMQYSVNPLAIAHQQEETLKDNNQIDAANDSVTLFNNGDGTKQNKAKSWKSCSLRSQQIKSSHRSTLSQQMPLNEDGRSVQQNVLEKPSDSDLCSESGDDERNLAQNNQNTKNKYTPKMSTSVERNTKQINMKSPNRLNNSSLRMLSSENVKQTVQQAVFEEPSYSNFNPGIKSANDLNMDGKNSNRKTTDQSTSNIEHNSRRSRVKTQNLTASSQVPSTKEIEQTSRHIALRWSSNSDSGSEDVHENPMPEKNFKENKNSKNKSTSGPYSSNRNLNSRKNKIRSSDCRARSVQAVTLDRYSSDSSSEEDCKNCKENKNPKGIRGRTLSRIDPSSRRSKVKPRDRLLQEVPASSNKQTETDQQIASERSDSKNDFPKKREISRKSTEHTSSRIEQNSKNIRVGSMEGLDKPLIYMPIIQNFHKETERENGRCDKEKKCEKAIKTVSMTKDVGCQKEIFDLITSDEDVENMDKVLTPRKHNVKTKNKKMFLRQSNNTNNPEPNRTDICGVETVALHCSLESSDINTVENCNDKFVAVNSMQKNDIIAMNKVSQTHNRPQIGQIVRKGKKRFSQMDPIKQDYLNIRKKLKNATMQNVNVSRRKLYSKGNSDEETSELSDISQETPVIPHSKEETRKTLNFSRNPRNEKVLNKSAQRLQSINSCVGDSNNEGEFTDSISTVDAVNKNDIVFKKPTKPVSKPPKKRIGKKDIAKVNSNNAMQKSNPVISMEEKHQSRIVSRNETLKINIPKESTNNECNSSDLPVEPDEVNDQPIEPVAISRTSVEEKNNNRKARLSDIPENTKSMLRRTDETKDNNAKQSQKNKKEKYSHGSKSKPMKSSHPPSEELNERLRRSSRQRKLPIPYWSCRLQHFELGEEEIKETFSTNNNKKKKMPLVKKNKTKIAKSKKELKSDENKENSENLKSKVTQNNVINKDAADRVTMNENQIANEFDRLKQSFSIEKSKKRKDPRTNEENLMNKTIKLSENPSTKVPECNEKPPKAVNEQETVRVSSDDGISTSEENHHPKPPWCTNMLRTPTTDSGNQTGTINDTHVNKENRLFSWLKNLSTPRTLTRNKDVVQILHSNTIKIANVEDLMFQEVNGVEYAYYLEEDNNYGYMKFHPHSAKPNARTKNVELKFLSLVGSVQMKIDETLITIKNGDLVTVSKGVRYCISNPSNDPAVLFFIRTINPM